MKILRVIARIITGAVFVFSGTVKAIDPLGSTYKFSDYFTAFGLDFMQPLCLPLAFLLCLAEFITGFSLLTGIKYKAGVMSATVLMSVFTPLTLILALTNPVSDCGCFGDAIKLTNWQTFWKNVVLMTLVLILIFDKNKPLEYIRSLPGWLVIFSVSIIFVGFTGYNLKYLPIIDFLPYKKGNNIKELMEIPEGAPAPVYKTTFIYEKNGIRKEFTLDNFPADDTTWKFIDQKSVLVKKGYEPPIHGFSLVTADNRDITDMVLNNSNFTLLMISPKLEKAKPERLNKGFQTGHKCMAYGIDFYVLTATSSDKIKDYDSSLQFCLVDEITLKTMVRSNPGYIMLRSGTITGKWSWANLPEDIENLIKTNN